MKKEALINFNLFVALIYWTLLGYLFFKIGYYAYSGEYAGAVLYFGLVWVVMMMKGQVELSAKLEAMNDSMFFLMRALGASQDSIARQSNSIHKILLYDLTADEKARMMAIVEANVEDEGEVERVRKLLYSSPSEELAEGFQIDAIRDFMFSDEEPPEDLEKN